MLHTIKPWLRRSIVIVSLVTLGAAGCGQGGQQVDTSSANAPTPAVRYEGSADAIEARTAAGARYAGLSADAVEGWTTDQDTYDGLSPDAVERWTEAGN